MPREISLDMALKAAGAGASPTAGAHLSPPELYELLRRPNAPADQLFAHLAACPACARELREMVENLALAEAHLAGWDLALSRAASTSSISHWRLPTNAGKYTIELHPHTSDQNRGLISVQVAPQYRDLLEGHHVSLRDSQGRLLLEGKIVNGEAVQEVTDIAQIETGFIVRTD